MSSSPNAPGRCECDIHTTRQQEKKRSKKRRRGAEEEGKHFGRGPKYLTLQMKWQNVESNAQTAQNVSQGRKGE